MIIFFMPCRGKGRETSGTQSDWADYYMIKQGNFSSSLVEEGREGLKEESEGR